MMTNLKSNAEPSKDTLAPSSVSERNTILKPILYYIVFSSLWILFSDQLVTQLFSGPKQIEFASNIKGWFFILVTSGLLYVFLQRQREQLATTSYQLDFKVNAWQKIKLALVFITLMLVMPFIGYVYVSLQTPHIEQKEYSDLSTIANLEARQIENWLNEREADAHYLTVLTQLAESVNQLVKRQANPQDYSVINTRIKALTAIYDYNSVMVVDVNGRLLLGEGPHLELQSITLNLNARAIHTKQVQRSQLFRDDEGKVHLDWAVPITVKDGQKEHVVAVVLLRTVANNFLYPLIEAWPTASTTAETLLVRREGDSLQYLNNLRHLKHSQLTLKPRLGNDDLPATVAVKANKPGIALGRDYRDTPVLAAYRPVAGTDWHIVAKIDRDEVFAPLWQNLYWILLIGFAAIVIITDALWLLWRQQQRLQALALRAQRHESNQLLAALSENSSDAILIKDLAGRYLLVNPEAARAIGKPAEDIIGRSDDEIMPLAQAQALQTNDRQVLLGNILVTEEKIANIHGERTYSVIKTPMRDESGNIVGLFCVSRDVTAQKNLQIQLEQREALLMEALDISRMGNWTLDHQTGNLFLGAQVYELLEVEASQSVATYEVFLSVIHPDDRDMVDRTYKESIIKQTPYAVEYRLQMPDGRIKWVQERCHTTFDDSGQPLSSHGTVQDITERIKTNNDIATARDLLQQVIDTAPIRVFWKDSQSRYLGSNTLFAQDAGLRSSQDLIGKDDFQMVWSEQAAQYQADDHAVMASGVAKLFYEEQQTTAPGNEIWLRTSKVPLKNQQQQVIGLLGIYEDITEHKQAEAKFKFLSQLYAVLSHCNQAIVRCKNQEELFQQICHDTVIYSNMKMAWIGLVDNETQMVKPVAFYGDHDGYLDHIQISVDATSEIGQGPTGTAIRDGHPVWVQDFQQDTRVSAWSERAKNVGWRASASLPLRQNGKTVGAFMLYADMVDAFDEDIRNLLEVMAEDISDALDNLAGEAARKQIEKALLVSQSRLVAAQSYAGIGYWELYQDGTTVWSEQIYTLYGLSANLKPSFEVMAEILDGQDYALLMQSLQSSLITGKEHYAELKIHRLNDGAERWIECRGMIAIGDDGEPTKLSGFIQDVTERKQVQEVLRHSEERLQLVLRGSRDAPWDWNLATNELYYSPHWWAMLGYEDGELQVGEDLWEKVVHPEDLPKVNSAFDGVITGDSDTYEIEFRMQHKDGHYVPVLSRGFILRDANGTPLHVSGTNADLTERKRLEAARENALALLQKVASRVPGVLYQYRLRPDGSACFPYASDGIRDIYRVSPQDVIDDASPALALIHPDDFNAVVASIQHSAKNLTQWRHEYRAKYGDGTIHWLFGNAVPEREPDGATLWHGFITDITERKASEVMLRKLSQAVEQSPESIVISDINANIEYVNEAFLTATGYAREEVLGKNSKMLQSGKTPAKTYKEMWSTLSSGELWKGEFINRTKDGQEFTEYAIISPLREPDGNIQHYVAVKEDITEKNA